MNASFSPAVQFSSGLRKAGFRAIWAGATGVMLAWLFCPALPAATVLSRAPNVAVYLGLPFNQLEFENPLAGSETVLSHKVLDWRDADYAKPGHPLYDDWGVSGAGTIDGNINEIYMRQPGQSISTTTSVHSTIVSIHLDGDDNDGKAQVLVDGVEVAQLDMYNPVCCQTAWIVVKGLSDTPHTITVNDLGVVPGRQGTDVHAMGAAALQESDLKWNQPPVGAHPTNVFYGWNQPSMEGRPPIAADDWVCTTTNPVTKVRWWGSFANWRGTNMPIRPQAFVIRFWSDVPKGADPQFPDFSHPGVLVRPPITATSFTARFVGWDFDPRANQYEACFLFEQTLAPEEWFYQQPTPTGTNIYWMSIEATGVSMEVPWGWKTRPRDSASLAPDDAVMFDPGAVPPMYAPIFWPTRNDSWDLAFELISDFTTGSSKWEQRPDLSSQGMDVKDSIGPPPPPVLLADDFRCTSPGPITNITIWGSWRGDVAPSFGSNVTFTLSIHQDVPANDPQNPFGYSVPGALLWQQSFSPGQFNVSVLASNLTEGWYEPPTSFLPQGDTKCFQYDFNIPAALAFPQQGSPAQPKVYWLDCQANVLNAGPELAQFGWKTCITNWNAAAVWANASEPYSFPPSVWNRLLWMEQRPLDLAFRINSAGLSVHQVKWSQPPAPFTPPDGFNGWNERSVYGSTAIVADDWTCTNAAPVTDVHWWGSFLNWGQPSPPQLPDAFVVSLWTDVPQGADVPFSHPGQCLTNLVCTNFTWAFVGWDFDPRDPGAAPEACFKFEQDLREQEWFWQRPGTNIYWLSIAAQYAAGQTPANPWGWKTRPRDPASLAPDDAVRIFVPTAPVPGSVYEQGENIWWPDPTKSRDMAFVLTTKEIISPTNDFGDAPSPYPTLLANNGARHTVVPGVMLGKLIDAELNGQPDPLALGDDNNNLADEDGVALQGLLIPGEPAAVKVTASVNGFLSAWFDFNADSSWATPGDQIFTNLPISAGSTVLNFNIPLNAARGAYTFARFRFSTAAITNFTGGAADGEVEDYRWYLEELDFGDAADLPFPTKYASNGARHWILRSPPVFLGQTVDNDPDGQPNASATGDDLAGLADEDGVTPITPLLPGQMAAVRVVAGIANGVLNAWIDFAGDGSWATPGDQIANNLILPIAGPNVVTFLVPPNAAAGSNVFARFRFSTMANLSYTNQIGLCPNGEVEDYRWHIDQLDFGDAPDPKFPTLLANDGARHVIGPLFLGATVDAETDGQPNATATGDDLAGMDDEDGVFFPTALIANAPATLQVVSSGAGYLQGWFDFDGDGTWTNVNDHPIHNRPVVAGTNLIQLFIPNAVPGRSCARFRLSTQTNLTFTGQAPDGEVEDYAITFYPLKWNQPPEQGSEGVDVYDGVPLADDFLCRQSGPVTDIHLWGSFRNDLLPIGGPASMTVTLTFYADVPAGAAPSRPGNVLWTRTFSPGQFAAGLSMANTTEWYHDPRLPQPIWQRAADTNIWQFDFYVAATNAFQQVSNTVYWLGVQYTPLPNDTPYHFGWKTTYLQWNDAACWFNAATGNWAPLLYGDSHPKATQQPPFNQMDFAFALSTEKLDWGDAPAPYPTLAANNGAAHVIIPGLMLGNVIDSEADGQPNATASGDDNNPPAGPDDEDGVIFPVLVPGQPGSVQVTVTGSGFLNAWLDFGGDGSWAQPGDQIFTNLALATGVHTLNFAVPNMTPWGVTTFARFRFSTATNLSYTGLAPDGEVEDYKVDIHPLPNSDLGDAPDSSNHAGVNMTAYPKGGPPGVVAQYPTVFGGAAPFGPLHINTRAVSLGPTSSGELEADGLADQDFVNNIIPPADTPDLDAGDDGLIRPVLLPHCGGGVMNVAFTWTAVVPQMVLNIWCDWNRDGDWNDTMTCPDGSTAPEWACQNMPVPGGVALLAVPIKAWHLSLQKQPIWIRITLSEIPAPGPAGFSGAGGDGPQQGYQFGETEDYYLADYDYEQKFDFGDAPAPYPTLLANNGARHLIVPNFRLGNLIDDEADGLPHTLALGDDLNNAADEDGVSFAAPLLAGTQACVNVFLTGPAGGKLDGWLDFNKNGTWEAAERIYNAQALVAGLNAGLCFNVPTNAVLGTNFARFRLSSLGGLSPTGAAQDGEVEDYQFVIRQRRPTNNIVITNITVTNFVAGGVTQQLAAVVWSAEPGVHYQLLAAATLGTNGGPSIVWTNVGPEVIGPANSQTETNTMRLERYYRVVAPWTYP